MSARTPLRAKLIAALMVLTTAAVVLTAVSATVVLRSYLFDRVDRQLDRFTNSLTTRVSANPPTAESGEGDSTTQPVEPTRRASPYYFVVRDNAGTEVRREGSALDGPGRVPRLPAVDAEQAKVRDKEPYTAPAIDKNQPRWRAMTRTLPDGSGSVTLALSLEEVDATVGRLIRVLTFVGLGVLGLTGAGSWLIVRSSLRPLREVETTAEAIAAGDLSRRVPVHPNRTEVGRLSAAVNTMLGHIETAVIEKEATAAAAQASEERMRRFIADASHELRTPLTSIRGFAELYRQGAVKAPEQVPGLLARIEDEATRMGLLVEDLLLLARLDQARPLEREPVDLVAVATDAVVAARVSHPDRRVEVRVVGEEDVPPDVLGDDARLRQVAGNLIANACTHTPAGTAVRVSVGSVQENGARWAVLEVADEGPGLSAEECDRVFERFYRTDSSRNRRTGGSGLGLSIVAALVAAHGGKVEVKSAPGAGATFRVRLPNAPV
ncbi:MAG: HAMP domain-containing sensor histidine kinase [Sporichthyaceae bacterium]